MSQYESSVLIMSQYTISAYTKSWLGNRTDIRNYYLEASLWLLLE